MSFLTHEKASGYTGRQYFVANLRVRERVRGINLSPCLRHRGEIRNERALLLRCLRPRLVWLQPKLRRLICQEKLRPTYRRRRPFIGLYLLYGFA